MRGIARFSEFFGLRRSTVGMLCMVILVGMGERMAERFLPIYLMALGGGALSIGALSGLDNLLSALYSFPGGYLSDRLGTKRALLVFNSWTAISLPATMSLIAKVLPMNKRTMGVSMHSFVRRIPMALGPILGGLCIGIWGERNGVRLAFVAAFLLSCVAALLQQHLIEDVRPEKADGEQSPSPEKNPLRLLGQMSLPLKRLLISDILVRFCEQIPYAFVVVWCMKRIAEPVTAFQFGILTSIEMLTAMLIYIPVAYLADRSTKKPFVTTTFLFFTLFPLALLFCKSFTWLVFAFILRGLKEFGEPTRKALIMDLAPENRKAGMFGLYYLLRDVIVSVAAFGGAFLWQISPASNFLIAFSCGLVGTIGFALRGSDLSRDDSI
jgi:MFS family permease